MRKFILMTMVLLLSASLGHSTHVNNQPNTQKTMAKYYYCEYCGHKAQDARTLLAAPCPRHPDGCNKGKHKLYEGSEKSQYLCKYCGRKFPSIMVMTGAPCANHPKGTNKGNHSPAL